MLNSAMIELLGVSIVETLYMVLVSTLLAYVIGLPIGVVLHITSKDGICPNSLINSVENYVTANAERYINAAKKKLNEIGYSVEYDDSVIDYIFNIVKDEKEYGARPIMRAIQDTIEDKITDTLLAMDYENGHTFNISCTSDLSELAVA